MFQAACFIELGGEKNGQHAVFRTCCVLRIHEKRNPLFLFIRLKTAAEAFNIGSPPLGWVAAKACKQSIGD